MSTHKRIAIVTQQARADLIAHRKYIEDKDPDAARRLIINLVQKIHDIAAKGLTGSKRLFLPDHIKAFPYKSHCFYFTVNNGTLTLLRVLAQKQDTADIIFEADEA